MVNINEQAIIKAFIEKDSDTVELSCERKFLIIRSIIEQVDENRTDSRFYE